MLKKGFVILVFSLSFAKAAENSVYDFKWLDKDKEIYVLQNRVYRKSPKIAISAGAGMAVSGPFIESTNYQARLGHFFREDLGFEIIYSYNQGRKNDTAASVENHGIGSGSIPYYRRTDNYIGGALIWSPFYGKLNTFNQIIYFDLMLGIGAAQLTETNNGKQTALTSPILVEETHATVLIEASLLFYLSRHLNFRVDLVANTYKDNQFTTPYGEINHTQFDLNFALGFVL